MSAPEAAREGAGSRPSRALLAAVARAERWITEIYRLELGVRATHFLVAPEDARKLLPPDSPRSGVLVVEEASAVSVGMYVDPEDEHDHDTVVEETSHLLHLAWLVGHDRPASRLTLELQGEVDRYAVARLTGRDPLAHFEQFEWAEWLDAADRAVYAAAHRSAHRYCRDLDRRYPQRRHTPALLAELRRFYRAPSESKLRLAA